jgi:hypothetical protein
LSAPAVHVDSSIALLIVVYEVQEADVAGGQFFDALESVSEKLLLRQRAGDVR